MVPAGANHFVRYSTLYLGSVLWTILPLIGTFLPRVGGVEGMVDMSAKETHAKTIGNLLAAFEINQKLPDIYISDCRP